MLGKRVRCMKCRACVPSASACGLLSRAATWPQSNARNLLGLGSGITWPLVRLRSRGFSQASRPSFRFLHSLLANIKCQRTMSSSDGISRLGYLAQQGFTPSHRTATWPTRLRGTLPVSATESERSLPNRRCHRRHSLLQTLFNAVWELLSV